MKKEIHRKINERLKLAIHAVINQQIAERNPPETLETLERLQSEGFSEEEAYNLIGHLVSMEVAEQIAGESGINMERFLVALEKLPAPFAKDRQNDVDDE